MQEIKSPASSLDFVSLLSCPLCHHKIQLKDQNLVCTQCSHVFPVINGIPRFVGSENYVQTFGFEWNRFEVQIPTEDDEIFRVKTGWTPEMLRGKKVLDAGCGSGRYSAVAAKWGAQVVGMDMSLAVEKAKKTCAGLDVQILQGDLHNPPLQPESFDFVFSIGVLHHSSDTKKAFQKIANLLKPQGHIAVWLYKKNTWPQELLNDMLRFITTKLPTGVLMKICSVLAVISGIPVINKVLGRIINLGATHPDFRLRHCDAYDWYSPTYQFHHTEAEVTAWAKELNFSNIRFLPPQRKDPLYIWFYRHCLIIGSGVNVSAQKG